MAYSGLETLFQNMGPTFAASMAGEREGTAQGLDMLEARKKQEELLAQQQAYRQAELTNPLKVQYEQGRINEQGALLPGQQAESRLKGTAADIAGATAKSTIGKTNSANDLAQMGDQVEKLSKMRDMATQLVANIMSAGPGADAAKNQLIVSGKLPPQIAQMLVNVPAAKLPDLLAKANAYVKQQTADYLKAIATANISKESHIAGANIAANAMLKGKQMDIDAGKFKDKSTSNLAVKFMALSPDKQLAEIAQALATNKNPFTGEELDDETKAGLIARMNQNKALIEGGWNAKMAGAVDAAKAVGMEPKTVPSATPSNKTKSLSIEDMRKALQGQ